MPPIRLITLFSLLTILIPMPNRADDSLANNFQADNVKTDEHAHHLRIGSHGMVLFTDGHHLFASHLPLYQAPHDYQLIYQIKMAREAQYIGYLTSQENTTEHSAVLTLLPEDFDLNRLIEGESFSLEATVFQGHFERGGKRWAQDTVEFEQLIYRRHLSGSLPESAPVTQWQVIPLPSKRHLLVHQIRKAPSFDAIYLGDNCIEPPESPLNVWVAKENQSLTVDIRHCQHHHPLYIEFQDFLE
ncbi:hypothetical protein [Planctobacterium marinum]|uniref:Secreted protein n=1 Tax=Planctobacterium marinum TaxID=1631968 RepID=A0AA48HVU3_9ALTE|nr:hypothetical protein MACH26_10210 [Planctobacterium marinum]